MPTFAGDLLPDQAGRNLGSADQYWNLFTGSVYSQGSIGQIANSTVSFSPTPTFDASTVSGFTMTLTGDVTASTLTGTVPSGYIKPLTFKIIQDGTGGRSFTWPLNVKGGITIDASSTANQVYVQLFHWDGLNAYAIAPGAFY